MEPYNYVRNVFVVFEVLRASNERTNMPIRVTNAMQCWCVSIPYEDNHYSSHVTFNTIQPKEPTKENTCLQFSYHEAFSFNIPSPPYAGKEKAVLFVRDEI